MDVYIPFSVFSIVGILSVLALSSVKSVLIALTVTVSLRRSVCMSATVSRLFNILSIFCSVVRFASGVT